MVVPLEYARLKDSLKEYRPFYLQQPIKHFLSLLGSDEILVTFAMEQWRNAKNTGTILRKTFPIFF